VWATAGSKRLAERWKEIRVFISSTFRDMHAERDHLVRFVFPRLREQLLERRIHFVDVDLRWGVTADQDAFELCMDEIDRCRPRFICLLGGRYGWVPPGAEESITALEVEHGALAQPEAPQFRYFYFRDPAVTASIPAEHAAQYREAPGSAAAVALDDLKRLVREAGLPVFDYPCAWDGKRGRIAGLERLGERVYEDLLGSVVAELGPEAPAELDALEKENALADAFVEARAERYVVGSRAPVFDRLQQHAAATGGNGYLCLLGERGSGKSALLSRFYREYTRGGRGWPAHPGDLVVPHFLGVNATNVRDVLVRLCNELALGAGIERQLPDDYMGLQRSFESLLETAAAGRRVVLLIDAIDQLEDIHHAHDMSWLPETLPADARVILSALEGRALQALRSRRKPPDELDLPMLDDDDAGAVVDLFLAGYRKTLDAEQRTLLLAKRDAHSPLYLLGAVEELRTLGAYEEITERIRAMPGEIEPMFDWILARLEEEDGFRDERGEPLGEQLVRAWCSCLACGRSGMAEAELVDLVSPGDPKGNVAALQRLLRPYLMRRGGLLGFFHQQFTEAVKTRYLAGGVARVHESLARYFHSRTYQYERTLTELAYHQGRAGLWPELMGVLTDLEFLELTALRLGPSASVTGAQMRVFLEESLAPLPDHLAGNDRRMKSMTRDIGALSAALELLHVRRCGHADDQARCRECEEAGIVHGHVDLGGVDYYDNYYAWCPSCFWAWHREVFSSYDEGELEFDVESNTYR
jgi:hypothetical protein